ncbi:MAG: hypothetical protein ACP5IL_02300 [Syntrophobacteraceae bacterium]
MSYGLRRYETLHRLWWLVFFLLCLCVASFLPSLGSASRRGPSLADLGKLSFWTGLEGVGITSPGPVLAGAGQVGADDPARSDQDPSGKTGLSDDISMVGGALLFFIRVGVIFLLLRLVWLVVQFVGKYLLQLIMSEIKGLEPSERGGAATGADFSLLPMQVLDARIRRSVLSFFLHPFIRLQLTLSGVRPNASPENVLERARRAEEADWRILYGSWGPYRCLLWSLPILGLAQTVLLLIAQFHGMAVLSSGQAGGSVKPLVNADIQKQILEIVKPTLDLLLPLIQAVGVVFFLQLASIFVRSCEELYLSSLDAFLYDKILSRLSYGGNDSGLILETLQRHLRELSAAFVRLEKKVTLPMGGERLR